MKYIRQFDSVQEMNAAIQSSEINIIGMAMDGNTPVTKRTPPTPPTPPSES